MADHPGVTRTLAGARLLHPRLRSATATRFTPLKQHRVSATASTHRETRVLSGTLANAMRLINSLSLVACRVTRLAQDGYVQIALFE